MSDGTQVNYEAKWLLKVEYVEWAEQRHLMSRDRSRNNQKVIPAVGLPGPVPDFILALTL